MGIYGDEDGEIYSLMAGIGDGDGEKFGGQDGERGSNLHTFPALLTSLTSILKSLREWKMTEWDNELHLESDVCFLLNRIYDWQLHMGKMWLTIGSFLRDWVWWFCEEILSRGGKKWNFIFFPWQSFIHFWALINRPCGKPNTISHNPLSLLSRVRVCDVYYYPTMELTGADALDDT